MPDQETTSATLYLFGEEVCRFVYRDEPQAEDVADWLLSDEAPLCECIRARVRRFVVHRACRHVYNITALLDEHGRHVNDLYCVDPHLTPPN